MYPNLSNQNELLLSTYTRPIVFKKTIELSKEISDALLQLQKNNIAMTSMRPNLNCHSCNFSIVLPSFKQSIPLKIIFLRRYPKQKPIIYVTNSWRYHPLIRPHTNEVNYEAVFPWKENSKLFQLIQKLQSEFNAEPPSEKGVLEEGMQQLEDYLKRVEQWKSQAYTQPPPPPKLELETVLKTFQMQDSLMEECRKQEQVYEIKAQEYIEGVSRLRCISERFSKGKILGELEKMLESQIGNPAQLGVDELIKEYFQIRKEYHKTKILKDLYIEKFS